MNKIQEIQRTLGVTPDGVWGPKSAAALEAVLHPGEIIHQVLASSFADPADVRAFKRCKAKGKSDLECFKVGDNGKGVWGDDTTTSDPACALPPEDMEERWGSIDAAKHKKVIVEVGGKRVVCTLKDRMPRRAAITNGCGIDLTPGACAALDLKPPFEVAATWKWA